MTDKTFFPRPLSFHGATVLHDKRAGCVVEREGQGCAALPPPLFTSGAVELARFLQAALGHPGQDSRASPRHCCFCRRHRNAAGAPVPASVLLILCGRGGAKGPGRLWRSPRSCCHPSGLLGGTGYTIVTIIEKYVARVFALKNSYLRYF